MVSGLIFMFSFVVYEAYLQFYPFRTLEVKSATAKTTLIKAGDVFIYTVNYCKYTDKPATVFRTLHNVDETSVVPFPSVSTISVEGCHTVDVPLQTFPTISPGDYYLLIDARFNINPQRETDVVFKTNNFTIK